MASCCKLILWLAWLTAAAAVWAAESGPVCVVLTREGRVEMAPRGSAQWRPVQTHQVLQLGDRLRTGLRSRATLRWSDLSVVRVDALTSMEIQPPARPDAKPQLDLKSGATYFFGREKPADVEFRTPAASGAIRGTEFNLAVEAGGRTVLALLNGEVSLTNASGQATVRSGEQGIVEPGEAPTTSPLLEAVNVIQWVLYYPAVVYPGDLGWSAEAQSRHADSLAAYAAGDLLAALDAFFAGDAPRSVAGHAWGATLLLAAGRVDQTEAELDRLPPDLPVAKALRELIAAVKHQAQAESTHPETASEWLARSYSLQSRAQLQPALLAARTATTLAPDFGAAWIRLAELEFGFGRTSAALAALQRGLALSPRNGPGRALNGFLLAAQDQTAAALEEFDRAIAIDGALATAWLGRGLTRIRSGQALAGRADLQVAATLEPQRSVLRSYLGKAFSHTADPGRARKELELAMQLDPNDPTPWLYSALLHERQNRVNQAVRDLERSQELNDNRSLFRSRLLLDQDQAVRSANLAAIYRDAGLVEFSAQEAARAVNQDYGNYSAHLFLANSYDALRDPKLVNLRYEAPWFSEWLIASLLAPAGAGALSQSISQQEYSRFFDTRRLGLFSSTEYSSRGDWFQLGSQYGHFGTTSYSVDAGYRTENGYRPNNDLEQLYLAARVKQQITPKDSLFFQASYFDADSGDVAQYYDPDRASSTLRVSETQAPNLLLGYHRAWAPGSHTLFLGARFDDTLRLEDTEPALLYLRRFTSPFTGNRSTAFRNPAGPLERYRVDYRRELVVYSAELQHIWQTPLQTLILGGRYQQGEADTETTLDRQVPNGFPPRSIAQSVGADLERISLYAYDHFQVLDSLRLTAGVSYDRLHYPANVDTSPIIGDQETTDQVSPKAGLQWSPFADTHLRGAYTRSLGGVFFDTSVRLEPTQIGGFTQAYRSLVPESVAGLVPGTEFETWGVGFDQNLRQTGTYLLLQGELLESGADRTVGILTNSFPPAPEPDSPSSTRQALDYRERSLVVAVNQLLGQGFAFGTRYRLTDADLVAEFTGLPVGTVVSPGLNQNVSATLHQVQLLGIYNHPSGCFAQFDATWSQQSNRGYIPELPGDDFWQYHAFVGYRFLQRRAELRLGLLNLTDRDYRLNPLTLYRELPRERTFVVNFKFYF